jgi:hypothetical protein
MPIRWHGRVPSAHARGGSPVRGRAHRVGIGARSHRLKGLNQRLVRDIWLLRLSALLARARGDDVAYRDLVNRYRAMAKSLGFDGHKADVTAMAVVSGITATGTG